MNTNTIQQQLPVNTILKGNCIEKMRQMHGRPDQPSTAKPKIDRLGIPV